MLTFIARRLLISIPVLLLSSVLVFVMVTNSGDPLAELKTRNPPVPAHVIEAAATSCAWTAPYLNATGTGSTTSRGATWVSPSGDWTLGRCWSGGWP